jgi:uncharacterized membrane protein YcjF (UPF0283 family)
MARFLSAFTLADWLAIGSLALVPLLMVLGISLIRREVRAAARVEVRAVKLKTSEEQRRRWRQETVSGDLLNLLDDIETLLRLATVDETTTRQEHKEAVRLSWMSRHIPIRTALLGGLLLAGALSAILMVLALGPSNPIP